MPMSLHSPAFLNQHAIPARHTCDGMNTSPPLSWNGVPPGTRSLALIVDDPDAPDPAAPQMTFVHWVLYNIPPDTGGLEEGASPRDLPLAAEQGLNDWDDHTWGGPCPPSGRHRYFFKLYALNTTLPHLKHPTKGALEQAMRGHVLEQAELIGLYQRH
ncbi:MAG TPA: YbhB/YbcL family Raf kinase inhibitor-like protein [Gallionellaceae bacterium]